MCKKEIKEFPTKEDGSIRLDAFGKPWCIECTDKFDNLDLEEVFSHPYAA
jgi:hypothetical protein